MSPRAACRLEAFGFVEVYDYTAGIADWKAADLDVDGSEDQGLRIIDATRPDIPTSSPQDPIGGIHGRASDGGWDEALVVDCDGVVVGRLRGQTWGAEPATEVGQVMEPGPTTVRPDGSLHALHARMENRQTQLVVVSDAQGRLIGVVLLDEARRLASGEPAERVWQNCDGCPGRWKPIDPTA
jgi:hypothetical protein